MLRTKRFDELEQHRRFARQLARHQEWDELVRFLTQYPATFLPLDRVALYLVDHRDARLELISEWRAARPRRVGTRRSEIRVRLAVDRLLVGVLRLRCRPGAACPRPSMRWLIGAAPEMALAIVRSRALAEACRQARRDERRRIAQDLHQSMAQTISALHLSLDRLGSDDRLRELPELHDELERLRRLAGMAYEQAREALAGLRLPARLDLARLVQDYARDLSPRDGPRVEVFACGEPAAVSPVWGQQVLRLAQEGLANAVKHSRARRVRVDLEWGDGDVSLSVADDGVGFDPASAPPAGHFGLAMLHEGVQSLRGEFELESALGRGTRLSFRIPFPKATNPGLDDESAA